MAIAGIILGLVGSAITQTTSIFTMREQRKLREAEMLHEAKSWEHETAMIKLASQGEVARLEMDVILTQVRQTYEGLKASIAEYASTAKGSHRWARTLSTIMRPIFTFTLLFFIMYWAWLSGAFMDGVDQGEGAVIAVIELGSMAVSWWFGDRSNKRTQQNARAAGEIRAAGGSF